MKVFSIIILPFSMFLVIGGQYIVDTGTLASAPYTGVIIFGVGALMLMLAMLAFVGSSFEYRRLLSICCLLSFIVGTCVVGISIAYYAMRDGIQSHLVENWELIRVILPPTYQAQYDRDQFSSFMETNLKMAAFVGIISGLFLLLEAAVCMTLMHYSTLFKRQLAQDKENMKHVQAATSSPSGTKVDHVPHHVHARRQVILNLVNLKL
uniref:Uncharacterized protein n=1 Tax=Globisporangium ultimum (strain ATCC 200006 / CBS 805.95 / DAOM BR144) TaxID=431595 RepID=K3WPI9_GLOUD